MEKMKYYILGITFVLLIVVSDFLKISEYKYGISLFFLLGLLLGVIEISISAYKKYFFMKEYKTLYFGIGYTILSLVVAWIVLIIIKKRAFFDYYIYIIKYVEVGIGFFAILLLKEEIIINKKKLEKISILQITINFILLLFVIKYKVYYLLLLMLYLEIYYIAKKVKDKRLKSFFSKSLVCKIISELLIVIEIIFKTNSLYLVANILFLYSIYIFIVYFNYILNVFFKNHMEMKDKEITRLFEYSSDGIIILFNNMVKNINKKAIAILDIEFEKEIIGKELGTINKKIDIIEDIKKEKKEIIIDINNKKIKLTIFKTKIGLEDEIIILLKEILDKDHMLYKFIEKHSDIVYIYEKDYGYRYINFAIENVLGYTKEEFYEKSDLKNKIIYQKDLSKYLEEEKTYIRLVGKNGKIIWLMENMVEVVIGGKEYQYVTASDITLLKKKEKELETENLRLQNMNYKKDMEMSIVSHELRTPITAIIGFVENILLNKTNLDDKMFNYISKIYNNSMRLKELVNNLLDYNKLLAGKLELNKEEIELKSLLNEILLNNEILTDIKGIEVINNIKDYIYILGDVNMMHQILNNIISNGIKYNSEKGKLIFDYEKNKEYVILKISDTGFGIKASDEEKIFKEYERVKGMKEKGTGLGLPLTKKLVELNKGKIWFSSEVGKGTTFYIEFHRR